MKHFDLMSAAELSDVCQGQAYWKHTGVKPGPTLVIIGKGPAIQAATERLQHLESLAYLRGQLLVCPEVPEISIDILISLKTDVEAEAYWHILGAAARAGMISGRGIPPRYLSAGASSSFA